MTLMRWNPVREMAVVQSALDRLFEENWRGARSDGNALALDVHENANSYTVTTTLPGVKADDVKVSLHDDVLTITGEIRQPETRKEDERVLLRERTYGTFTRSIRLPQPINAEQIEATFENGVLNLTLPKREEAQPRQIQVKVGSKQNNG
jgi:HSP20 family protein